jgi:hypothetical protein
MRRVIARFGCCHEREDLRMSRYVIVAGVALVLSACEGGITADEQATPAPEPAEAFVTQAEEICSGTRLDLDPARREVFGPDPLTPGDAQQTLERAGALLQTELEQLTELEVPAEIAAEAREWLAQVERVAQRYQAGAESTEAAEELMAEGDPLEEAEATADELGIHLCGQADDLRRDPTVEVDETP